MEDRLYTVFVPYLNKENKNGRIYDYFALEKMKEDFLSKKERGFPVMGELGYPDHFDVNLRNVSHIIEDLEITGEELTGTITILDTPAGKILKENFDKYVFRPRSTGNIQENKVVSITKLFTFDAILAETDAF